MIETKPWFDSGHYVPHSNSRKKQIIDEICDLGTVEGYHSFRDFLDGVLTLVPDDLTLESRRQWRGIDGRLSYTLLQEACSQTKHVVRSLKGLFPESGTFVADVVIHNQADCGCNIYKPGSMHARNGDALLYLMVEGPKIIRRLLAYIDELEAYMSEYCADDEI